MCCRSDERSQSAVLGVILVVAVTVLLGGVLAMFAFDTTSEPEFDTAVISVTQSADAYHNEAETVVEIQIEQTASVLDGDRIEVLVDGVSVADNSDLAYEAQGFTGTVHAGESVTIVQSNETGLHADQTVTIRSVSADKYETRLLEKYQLDGPTIGEFSFGHRYDTIYSAHDNQICTKYKGPDINPSRIDLFVDPDGDGWVPLEERAEGSVSYETIISDGGSWTYTDSDPSDWAIRVTYTGDHGQIVIAETEDTSWETGSC